MGPVPVANTPLKSDPLKRDPLRGRGVHGPGSFSLALGLLLALTGCGGGGGGGGGGRLSSGSNINLSRVSFGRLVDVFGLRKTASGVDLALFQKDVLVGPDIQDERTSQKPKKDEEILYDFISSDPDSLQPRLLITRLIGSTDFNQAFDALDNEVRTVAPAVFGQDTKSSPFSVVPRNAAIRLTFSKNLGIDDNFFVTRDPVTGRVNGLKNTEAVQLLKVVGDPAKKGGVQVIPARIVVRGNVMILDPVLLGTEGLQYQTRNNAAGMPESPDQTGANIRIAIALEGPLRIVGIRQDSKGNLTGLNNSGQRSVIRDFRSGNRNDSSSDISKGFIRDPIPPRMIGEIVMFLERVDDLSDASQIVTVFKNGKVHEIDRGDVIRIVASNTATPIRTEVVVDPEDDAGNPGVQHVRVVVRRVKGLETLDPSNNPNFPVDLKEREKWLVRNAPRAVLVAEFTAERIDPKSQKIIRDDPRNFLVFTPAPLPFKDGRPSNPNENVSPFAGAIVRFTKPVDMATVKGLDSFFIATRNLLDDAEIAAFVKQRKIKLSTFIRDKFMTPHLVFGQVFDEDGSQTAIRLSPRMGFYLDDKMRQADEGKPFESKQFRYFLHLLGGKKGILDLSGNALDFQSSGKIQESLVIPFSLDTRRGAGGEPLFPDNIAVTVARRFANRDEDEQPSYYLDKEIQLEGSQKPNLRAFNLEDVFGGVVYLSNGTLAARPAARITRIADDLNQQPVPPQTSEFRVCPKTVGTEAQVSNNTAGRKFGSPIQNPLNPFGCRLQTVWREIDMSLSRTDPFDFNLDVEQMFWAPFTGLPITFDEFDRMSLFLGHSEFRPEPCVGAFSALPSMSASGLVNQFRDNYAFNASTKGGRDVPPPPHPAYIDKNLVINTNLTITEPNGVNRYLPLPNFQKPFFVWRDERVREQGANAMLGRDTAINGAGNFGPYILSPFRTGRGDFVKVDPMSGKLTSNLGKWDNRRNFWITQTSRQDLFTGGLVGSIALPLLADFQVLPDSEDLPKNNPFRASGANGWQIAIPVASQPTPNFRAYSGGGLVKGKPKLVSPSSPSWAVATGGFTPGGSPTRPSDNSFYWIMTDFQKRVTVATAGFVEILNPHRVPADHPDPRLGPYLGGNRLPAGILPKFEITFEPPLSSLPGGTELVPEFRAAGIVDPDPWAAKENKFSKPDRENFPGDPLKAGDAHIRKFDTRVQNGQARNFWTYYYNKNLTEYTLEINQLMEQSFLSKFAGPNEAFMPRDVRYFNWRFILKNNVDANPPVAPTIDSFAITYRLEKVQ